MKYKTTMVIPSYWTREDGHAVKETDIVYDHPVPLNQEGTLKRALASLSVLKDKDFNLVVIAASNAVDIEKNVEEKVAGIISSVSSDVPIYLFSHSHLNKVHEALKREGHHEFAHLLSLKGYSNIRNLCIFLPHLLDSDVAVLIDDDEVFEDPMFMNKSQEFIGQTVNSVFVGAVAGYYLQPDGDWRLKTERKPWMEHWDKIDRMQQAFNEIIGREPRLKPTPFVFGGNMVLHKDIFTRIPFDPNVTRGEDIDYLINMKMFGYQFFLDNTLAIKHLPPPKFHPIWKQLREDIYRFVFERAKLRDQKPEDGMVHVTAEELDPYPGAFLKDDLETKARRACTVLSEYYRSDGNKIDAEESLRNIDISAYDAHPEEDAFQHIIDIKKQWETLMALTDQQNIRSVMRSVFSR